MTIRDILQPQIDRIKNAITKNPQSEDLDIMGSMLDCYETTLRSLESDKVADYTVVPFKPKQTVYWIEPHKENLEIYIAQGIIEEIKLSDFMGNVSIEYIVSNETTKQTKTYFVYTTKEAAEKARKHLTSEE